MSEKAIKTKTFEFGNLEIISDWGKMVWTEVRMQQERE